MKFSALSLLPLLSLGFAAPVDNGNGSVASGEPVQQQVPGVPSELIEELAGHLQTTPYQLASYLHLSPYGPGEGSSTFKRDLPSSGKWQMYPQAGGNFWWHSRPWDPMW